VEIKAAIAIDDDPIFCLVAEEALLSLGAKEVQTAQNGAEGLSRLQADPDKFDLVLCDLQMPNMDGVDVIRALGRTGFKGAVAIVSSEHGSVRRAVHAMAQMVGIRILGTLSKPLDTSQLKALILSYEAAAPRVQDALMSPHELVSAMMECRVLPYYQPKFNVRDRKVSSVEVLARHKDKTGQLHGPANLLASAERNKQMFEMTFVLIEQVVADYSRWRKAGIDIGLALNISPLLLNRLELPDILLNRFAEAGIDARKVTLEITEDKLLSFSADVLDILARLRIHGFRLSIDDFGTGATSFEQLQRFPFNELKIDQSFIRAPASDPFARTTVETSARLAAMLDMTVVAEGVETEDQLARAVSAGAAIIQGYLLAKPMASAELIRFLTESKKSTSEAA